MGVPVEPYLEHVLGDTWCIVTDYCRIPLYMPDRARAVMIDSGLKIPDGEGILELLKREKIHVSTLLTSHYHRDHVGNHAAIKAAHGCAVYMTPFAQIVGREPSNLQAVGYEPFTMYKARGQYPFCKPDGVISPEDTVLTVDGMRFTLLWLPGHAVEQVGFVTPDAVAYIADTLLSDHVLRAVKLPYYTCLRLDLQAKETLRALHCRRYILAHNGVYEEIGDLIDRNIAGVRERLAMVEQLAQRWLTLEQLCAAVISHLGFDLNSAMKVVGSKRNILILVEYLVETGRLAVRVRDGYVEYIAEEKTAVP